LKSKFYRLCTSYLLAALTILLLTSCAPPPEVTPASVTEITDQLGRVVSLDKSPQRIISLAPSNTEVLFALGLADRVIWVTKSCDYPPEAQDKPTVGGFSTPNIEAIVALSPDLILVAPRHEAEIIPQLEQKGLTVLALKLKTLDEVLDGIALVGRITGEEETAAGLVTEMDNRIKAVTDKTNSLPEDKRPRVFYLTWHDPLKTSGAESLPNELIEKAGGKNVFLDVTGNQSVDLELLVSRDPHVMIAGVGMGSGEDKTLRYLMSESRLQNTEAGKNDRIYGIDMDLSGRGGPRIVDGLEQLAKCIHPEIFGSPGD